MRPDLSFITINFNGCKDTIELIDSLQRVVHSISWEMVVVDNDSLRDEASLLSTTFAADQRVIIVRSDSNLGFAGGNNLGLRHANGKAFMFINNDTFVEEDHFDRLLSRLHSSPTIGAVCPKIRFSDSPRLIQYAGFTPLSAITLRNRGIGCGEIDKGQYNQASQTAFAHGAALLFKPETLTLAGEMTECYFLYYEEMDWSERIHSAGLQIWYEPAQTIFHKESQTTGQASPLRTYYLTRNRLLFARRNRKGVTLYLSYLYLTCVVLTKAFALNGLHRRFNLAMAALRGIWDFITL